MASARVLSPGVGASIEPSSRPPADSGMTSAPGSGAIRSCFQGGEPSVGRMTRPFGSRSLIVTPHNSDRVRHSAGRAPSVMKSVMEGDAERSACGAGWRIIIRA